MEERKSFSFCLEMALYAHKFLLAVVKLDLIIYSSADKIKNGHDDQFQVRFLHPSTITQK